MKFWQNGRIKEQTPIEPGNDLDGDVDGEDVVDRPEPLPLKGKQKHQEKNKDIGEKERKRARDTMDKLVQGMTSEDYAMHRPGGLLSIDLQFASILLKAGLQEKWITPKEFFSATHRIWARFFSHASGTALDGWVAYRCKHDDDPDSFKDGFAGPKLAAALGWWFLSIPEELESPEYARFYLAQLHSVARYPWIWFQDIDAVNEAINELLVNSAETLDEKFFDQIEKKWLKMMEEGHALQKLEHLLTGQSPHFLKDRISRKVVKKGEVLWQGPADFCIALDSFSRTGKINAKVLSIREDKIKQFASDFAIPAVSLLIDFLIKKDKQACRELNQVFKRISASMAGQL